MGILARWRGRRATAADAIHGDEATRAVAVARLQEIQPGAAIYLRGHEWRDCPDLRPGQYVDVRLVQFGEQISVDKHGTWVGVIGHHLECAWIKDNTHTPCVVLVARVDAILQSVIQ